MSARQQDPPVLVVGAGPAGLMAALALARYGIEFLLVERRRSISGLPRATAVSTRSMELLRSWRLEEEVRAGGIEVDWLSSGTARPWPAPMPATVAPPAFPPGSRARW